jgi:hypothetical protein
MISRRSLMVMRPVGVSLEQIQPFVKGEFGSVSW